MVESRSSENMSDSNGMLKNIAKCSVQKWRYSPQNSHFFVSKIANFQHDVAVNPS